MTLYLLLLPNVGGFGRSVGRWRSDVGIETGPESERPSCATCSVRGCGFAALRLHSQQVRYSPETRIYGKLSDSAHAQPEARLCVLTVPSWNAYGYSTS